MITLSCNLCKFSVRREVCTGTKTVLRTLSTSLNEEYSPEPQYPPILDLNLKARKAREAQAWHDKIQNLGTVEEKMIEVNMPRYYGWKCHSLKEGVIPYNSLAYVQHITKTHFIKGLPAIYQSKELEEAANECLNQVKSQVTEALLFELQREVLLEAEEEVEAPQVENARSQAVVQQLHSVLSACLHRHIPHLANVQVDPEPRVEAAWVAGGMEPTTRTQGALEGNEWTKDTAGELRDRHFQYEGKPLLQVRSEVPLRPFLEAAECESASLTVPVFKYDPRVLGTFMDRRHLTNIPGFWPGDKQQFGLLSFHSRSHLPQRPENFGADEHQEALHTQAILASFGWLLPQACLLGFSTFNELTYPLVTQTAITDGRLWSFYAYQMNTTLMHSHHATDPAARKNICWGSEQLALFEGIQDGKLVGLNDEVLKALLKLYLNAPSPREGVELRPYLDPEAPVVASIADPERRQFLESLYKYLNSNRPRHRLLPEYYHWEMIYKIKHKTRPMDARRRPFELWQNPWQRRLDDTSPVYIPKPQRTDMKEKFRKTFYP